jgi:shikimate dehydrogenase
MKNKNNISIIIGDPVDHSLSPAMHNAAYKFLQIDDEYYFGRLNTKIEDLKKTIEACRILNIKGITCTMPHKLEVMQYLDQIDPIAKKIGAVNTVLNDNGNLIGYNTDWLGVKTPLDKLNIADHQLTAGVIGAGGASRAVVYALKSMGFKVKVFNRTIEKAKVIADDFHIEYSDFDRLDEIKDCKVIFNATSIGMGEQSEQSPIPENLIHNNQIIFEAIYHPAETKLIKLARSKGAQIIHGLEMLLYQGTAQFEIYTGYMAPEEIMRKVLL